MKQVSRIIGQAIISEFLKIDVEMFEILKRLQIITNNKIRVHGSIKHLSGGIQYRKD